MRKSDRKIDRSTIYRALRLFVDVGIVVAADTGDGETYYEVAGLQPHHHLICRRCAGEWEIDDGALQAMFAEVAERHDFQVDTDHLVLFGYCSACRTKPEASAMMKPNRRTPDASPNAAIVSHSRG